MPRFRKSTAIMRLKAKERFLELCLEMGYSQKYILERCRTPERVKIRHKIANLLFHEGFTPNEIANAIQRERTAVYQMIGMRKGQANYGGYIPEGCRGTGGNF